MQTLQNNIFSGTIQPLSQQVASHWQALLQGTTWQQAVQWLPEVYVEPGVPLAAVARHDTYGISFGLAEAGGSNPPVVSFLSAGCNACVAAAPTLGTNPWHGSLVSGCPLVCAAAPGQRNRHKASAALCEIMLHTALQSAFCNVVHGLEAAHGCCRCLDSRKDCCFLNQAMPAEHKFSGVTPLCQTHRPLNWLAWQDGVWQQAHESITALTGEIAKSCVPESPGAAGCRPCSCTDGCTPS